MITFDGINIIMWDNISIIAFCVVSENCYINGNISRRTLSITWLSVALTWHQWPRYLSLHSRRIIFAEEKCFLSRTGTWPLHTNTNRSMSVLVLEPPCYQGIYSVDFWLSVILATQIHLFWMCLSIKGMTNEPILAMKKRPPQTLWWHNFVLSLTIVFSHKTCELILRCIKNIKRIYNASYSWPFM